LGASIEATLEFWAKSLRDLKARIRPLFTQDRVAASANAFLCRATNNLRMRVNQRENLGWGL